MHRIILKTDRTDPCIDRTCCRRTLPVVLGNMTLITVLFALVLPGAAQVPNQPPIPGRLSLPGGATQATDQSQAAPPADSGQDSPISQAQADKEWLTSYFLVHQGYKLHHMAAIDATLNKMTPTQLHTLREMYDQKHTMMMQQQALFNQWNAHQVAQAQAWDQRQQRQMSQLSSEETQSANLSEQEINQAHQEAAANAEMKNLSYPGHYGPYGGGGWDGGYIHPYFNPLGGGPY